jgi:hypothetical protein
MIFLSIYDRFSYLNYLIVYEVLYLFVCIDRLNVCLNLSISFFLYFFVKLNNIIIIFSQLFLLGFILVILMLKNIKLGIIYMK